jgi:REP element-mobilizing transposase RayT
MPRQTRLDAPQHGARDRQNHQVLMSNHVHLMFKSGRHDMLVVMRKLLTSYARYFNHRHNRTGHRFQNR